MMFREQQSVARDLLIDLLQFLPYQTLLKQLFLEPERHRHLERAKALRRKRDIGLQQPLEFQERLVVEGDMIDVGEPDRSGLEAIIDGVVGKRGVMFLAGEALLLRRRNDAAVLDQRGGAVVV